MGRFLTVLTIAVTLNDIVGLCVPTDGLNPLHHPHRESQSSVMRKDLGSDCSGYLTEPNGTISSPDYPNDYPNNAVCSWEVVAYEGFQVRLTFEEFHLESSPDCTKDYVEVYDGVQYHVFCGRQKPPVLESNENRLGLTFVSDREIQFGHKFSARYETHPSMSSTTPDPSVWYCSDTLDLGNASLGSFIYSPFHPSPYPERTSCSWTLFNSMQSIEDDFKRAHHQHPAAFRTDSETRLAFLRFDLDSTLEDYVRIIKNGEFFGQYQGNLQCDKGDHKLGTPVFHYLADETTVEFKSKEPEASERSTGLLFFTAGAISSEMSYFSTIDEDDRKQAKQPLKPFSQMQPKTIVDVNLAAGTVTPNSGIHSKLAKIPNSEVVPITNYAIISSPGHPGNYPPGTSLVFNITAEETQRIAVYFARFSTEPTYDRVWIEDMNSGWTVQLDGRPSYVYDQVFLSDSNWVEIFFYSDESGNETGFLAAVAAVHITGPCKTGAADSNK